MHAAAGSGARHAPYAPSAGGASRLRALRLGGSAAWMRSGARSERKQARGGECGEKSRLGHSRHCLWRSQRAAQYGSQPHKALRKARMHGTQQWTGSGYEGPERGRGEMQDAGCRTRRTAMLRRRWSESVNRAGVPEVSDCALGRGCQGEARRGAARLTRRAGRGGRRGLRCAGCAA